MNLSVSDDLRHFMIRADWVTVRAGGQGADTCGLTWVQTGSGEALCFSYLQLYVFNSSASCRLVIVWQFGFLYLMMSGRMSSSLQVMACHTNFWGQRIQPVSFHSPLLYLPYEQS